MASKRLLADQYDINLHRLSAGNQFVQLAALGAEVQIIVPIKTDRGGRGDCWESPNALIPSSTLTRALTC